MKILITGAATAYAHKVEKLLSPEYTVITGDSEALPEFMLKAKKMLKLPGVKSPSFAHELLTLCLNEQIDVLIPLRRFELEPLSKARVLFDEYGIRILSPSPAKMNAMQLRSGTDGELYINFFSGQEDAGVDSDDYGVFLRDADGGLSLFVAD